MADNAGDSTSWWQWIAGTAAGLYTAKLNSKVQIAANNAAIAAAQDNETLSFLGYDLHKKTLLWIGGGLLIASLVLVLLRKR